jgi:hypothetical protein
LSVSQSQQKCRRSDQSPPNSFSACCRTAGERKRRRYEIVPHARHQRDIVEKESLAKHSRGPIPVFGKSAIVMNVIYRGR